MHVNREKFTKSELAFSLIFFGYFLFIIFKSHEFINSNVFNLIYFLGISGYIVGYIIRALVLHLVAKPKDINIDDERDKFIVSKSYRNAHISTIILINVIIICYILFNNILQPAFFFNLLLGTLLISHIVLISTRIYYYKRGIQ